METSFKRCHARTAALSAPNPAVGHHHPMPQLETPENSWARLGQPLVGSLLLSPGSWCSQGSACALQESVSPVLCELGLMATSSKRAYAIPRSVAPRAPAPCSRPLLLSRQETLKRSKAGLAQSLWDLWVLVCTRFYLSPSSISF